MKHLKKKRINAQRDKSREKKQEIRNKRAELIMTTMKKPTIVQCPTCKANVEWGDKSPQRPFCSERCQRIDFGDWAKESFAIAGEPAVDTESMDEEF